MKLKINVPLHDTLHIRTGDLLSSFEKYYRYDTAQLRIVLKIVYLSYVMSIQTEIFSSFQNVTKAQQKIDQFKKIFQGMNYNFDEIICDMKNYEMHRLCQIFEEIIKVIKISYDNTNKFIKYYINNSKQSYSISKHYLNTCEKCYKQTEAVHLERLQIEYGLLYEQERYKKNRLKEKELKKSQTKDEFQQINIQIASLLSEKEKVSNLLSNHHRYLQLAQHIENTAERQSNELSQSTDNTKVQNEKNQIFNNYSLFVDQIRNILIKRINGGYSYKVMMLLKQFEDVIDNDGTRKVQKKSFINVKDQSIQTDVSPMETEIKTLKYQLSCKQRQLNGIRQNRSKVQDKYISMLTKQRQNSLDVVSIVAKQEQVEAALKKQLQDKENALNLAKQKIKKLSMRLSLLQNKPIVLTKHIQTSQIMQPGVDQSVQTDHELEQSMQNDSKKKKSRTRKISSLLNQFHIIKKTFSEGKQCNKVLKVQRTLSICLNSQNLSQVNIESLQKVQSNRQNQQQNSLDQTKKKFYQKSKENKDLFQTFNQKIKIKSSSSKKVAFSSQNSNRSSTTKIVANKIQKKQKQLKKTNFQFQDGEFQDIVENPHEQDLLSIKSIKSNKIIKIGSNLHTITKYHARQSSEIHKNKIKQILGMIKKDRRHFSTLPNQQINLQFDFNPTQSFTKTIKKKGNSHTSEEDNYKQSNQQSQNKQSHDQMIENIQTAKLLIESQYNFLKANGFIDYLIDMEKRNPFYNSKNIQKYKFKFESITKEDVDLFGGFQEMMNYSQQTGVWKRYINEQHKIKLYFKHQNFAKKIAKYLHMLKRINIDYFSQYIYFLTNPVQFYEKYFMKVQNQARPSTAKNNFINGNKFMNFGAIDLKNQGEWKAIFMRLIRYHNKVHKNCQHITLFLSKIGYYRYCV